MAPTNYSKLTVDELLEANEGLMAQKEAIREEQMAIAGELDRLANEEKARRAVEGLSDEEREALAQLVSPEGIESAEAAEPAPE